MFFPSFSVIPIARYTLFSAAALARISTSGPGTATQLSWKRWKSFLPSMVLAPILKPNVSPLGYPGINVSGKTTIFAPFWAASLIRPKAFSNVFSKSNTTGAACTTATLTVFAFSLIKTLLSYIVIYSLYKIYLYM